MHTDPLMKGDVIMAKFIVTIREELVKEVGVTAKNYDEALDKIQELYNNEDIVLLPEDHCDTNFEVRQIQP